MTKIPRPSKTRTGRGKKIYTEEDVDQMIEGQIKMFGQVKLKMVIDIIEMLRLKEVVKQNPDTTIGDLGKEINNLLTEWAHKDPGEFKAVMDFFLGRSIFLVIKKRH